MAGTRALSPEPPRSTAYYYADLERLKRKSPEENELSEYVLANEVVNDIPAREIPPLRDRQWSLPEYTTPENSRKGETYSTAGTFPMPEPKEKEPLLAELEVVGRLPLTQLDSSTGVRRSRSWYLCCPNVGEEEISRDSSWRYSSLRPVTVPPVPGQNGLTTVRITCTIAVPVNDSRALSSFLWFRPMTSSRIEEVRNFVMDIFINLGNIPNSLNLKGKLLKFLIFLFYFKSIGCH